jgi:condensin complex subunit 1
MRCGIMKAECLHRLCTGVRKNALMVLTHLILNDMMKVKGHISRMAMCLQVHPPPLS